MRWSWHSEISHNASSCPLNITRAVGLLQERLSPWRFGALCLALVGLVYVGAAWTPSHYSVALRWLGHPNASPVLGRARPVRSDEYTVLTPYFQIAVRNHFGPRNETSPYKETLKSFWALPLADAGLIFKPQMWGFWILPPAHAYSLYFFSLAAAFLVGYALLLRQLGAEASFAIAGSLLLFFSHYVQAWWTSNAAAFAFAPWPVIAFLTPMNWLLRWLALFWSAAVWLIGLMYPPFIVAGASALGILALAFRPDAFRLSRLFSAVSALLAASAVAWLYFHDIFEIMRNTVYPGQRHADGGGVPGSMLLAHLLPYLTTLRFSPLLPGANECEIAVVGSFLPLGFLVFTEYASLLAFARANRFAVGAFGIGLLTMLGWMTLPIPAEIGRFLLWDQVPAGRMLWGFGLLLTLGLVVLISQVRWQVTSRRCAIFAVLIVATWLLSKALLLENTRHAVDRINFDWVVLGPFALAVLLVRRRPHAFDRRIVLLAAFVATSIATFGLFNPVQSAKPIFDPAPTAVVEEARRRAAADPQGFVVGTILNGVGVPAINHVLLMPQLDFFRRFFPELPADRFNQIFNRYAHIVVGDVPAPIVPRPDVVIVPIHKFK